MTDTDVFTFMEIFHGLLRVFPIRGDANEIKQRGAIYFKALRRWRVEQLRAGAEAYIQHGKGFPKPAEWIAAIPTRAATPVTLLILSSMDAQLYATAEAQCYEGLPCQCEACVHAGIAQPLRFVPKFNTEGEVRAHDPIRDRDVTTGRWIHGAELARWYRARATFFQHFAETSRAHGTR